MHIQKDKGFIPIEVLIASQVVIVIASSVFFAQRKAYDVSFQLTTASVVPAALMCCYDGGSLNDVAGEEICAIGGSDTYPAATAIDSITVLRDCDPDGTFSIRFTPPPTRAGDITSAICTEAGCKFTGKTPQADQLISE